MTMLKIIKNYVLIILAILQFFSPWVHAHTGSTDFNNGFHIPGLESYLDNQDAASFNSVNSAWQSEGLLVLVDAGIKNPLDYLVQHSEANNYFAVNTHFPEKKLLTSKCNFSPHEQNLSSPKLTFPPRFPRAPPLNRLI